MYDPRVGRWLSQDPIGFAGGDANLYRYVGNNPTDAIDTTGLVGLFFDGTLQKASDNTIITRLQSVYTDPKVPVYRVQRTGLLDPASVLDPFDHVQTAREELACNVREALQKAKDAHEKGELIDLFGYSRGAVAALLVAQLLNKEDPPIPVRFMGLIDPSDTWSGWQEPRGPAHTFPITSNVKFTWVAFATGKRQKMADAFPVHFEPERPPHTNYSFNWYDDLGHWDIGRSAKVGKALWQAAKLKGVPVGDEDPY
jgi:hypothetical protein